MNEQLNNAKYVLEVDDLSVEFVTPSGVVHAVTHSSFKLREGEILGIVGESGSGKSVTANALMRLLPDTARVTGTIKLNGRDISTIKTKEFNRIRGKEIAMIFQDPMTSLNPLYTVGNQLEETLKLHMGLEGAALHKRAIELLDMVSIPQPEMRVKQYPHEFSGGMRQRIIIAIALANNPKLIIADEPTTALDVTIQAQILELIRDMTRKSGSSTIMITHDLGVVASMCDRINIMYGGKVVETGTDKEIFYQPNHPYTKGLLNCINDPTEEDKELTPIPGSPPDLLKPPAGCPFVDRCDKAMRICKLRMPEETRLSDTHVSACWLNELARRGGGGDAK